MTTFGALIPNGDFEAGNTGFTSQYDLATPPFTMQPESTYTVGTNPLDVHSLWFSMGDHTTGTGNMLIANGSSDTTKVVWQADGISVLDGTAYFFEAWVANVCCNANYNGPISPAQLTFEWKLSSSSTWNSLGSKTTNPTPGVWEGLSPATFTPGAGQVDLRLVNANSDYSGNDFAIDDITLETRSKVNPTPEPSSVLMGLAGVVAIGLGWKRRQ